MTISRLTLLIILFLIHSTKQSPIRITYDLSNLNKYLKSLKHYPEDVKKQFEDTCIKTMLNVKKFYQNLLEVNPKQAEKMKFSSQGSSCGTTQVPINDQKNSIQNSDLHIYVTGTHEPNGSAASAKSCQREKGELASFGFINFSIRSFKAKLDLKYAMNRVQTEFTQAAIHEFMHILAFDNAMFQYWKIDPKSSPTIQVGKQLYLTTPNVSKLAKEYYRCPTAPGLLLESGGGIGTQGSHWSAQVIGNEIMVGTQVATIPYFSHFTTALLKDTGYFTAVKEEKMAEGQYFGKGNGCDFLKENSKKSFKEYCKKGENDKCDFYHYAISDCVQEGNKMIQRVTKRQNLCILNQNQRCFLSSNNVLKSPNVGACFKYKCVESGKGINVSIDPGNGSQAVVCKSNGQVIRVPTGDIKQIQCPSNLNDFCNFLTPCPNECSGNGYCNKSKCICADGYRGDDCSIKG